MAEETYQELKSPVSEVDVALEPKFPGKLLVGNLVRRVWTTLFALYNGTLKRLVCDSIGRLRVSPTDNPWSLADANTSKIVCSVGSWDDILTGLGDTYKKVWLFNDGNDPGLLRVTMGGVTYEIYGNANYYTLLLEGPISKIEGLGQAATYRVSAFVMEHAE